MKVLSSSMADFKRVISSYFCCSTEWQQEDSLCDLWNKLARRISDTFTRGNGGAKWRGQLGYVYTTSLCFASFCSVLHVVYWPIGPKNWKTFHLWNSSTGKPHIVARADFPHRPHTLPYQQWSTCYNNYNLLVCLLAIPIIYQFAYWLYL